MAESDFQTELGRGFGLVGCHFYKIADMPHFLQKQARFKEKKPYDCFCLHYGFFVAMELKQPDGMSVKTQCPDNIRKGLSVAQEDTLLKVDSDGGAGLVVVNFLLALSAKEAKKRGINLYNRSFAAPVSRVVAARKECAVDNIPLNWWEANATELPACKVDNKAAWDPRPMLAMARTWRRATPWGA